jgi:protein-tyrosine phosphatase
MSSVDQVDRIVVDETEGILDMDWITDRIALGGWAETPEKMAAVARAGITHIIDMTWEVDDRPLAQPHGIEVLMNSTDDDFQSKAPELFAKGVRFAVAVLQQPNSKLLIHCVAGRHRGPMMTLAVLAALGWDLDDAMRTIVARRPIVDFAPVYVDSVRAYLNGQNHKGMPGTSTVLTQQSEAAER